MQTIVEAQVRRPSSPDHLGTKSETDPEAAWTRKGGKSHFGYKAHIGMDAGSGLIREAALTPANVNDTEVADELVSGDEAAVYADKAYGTKERSERLKSMHIKDRIMRRGNKHHPVLPRWERRRNQVISRLRAPVEKVFGTLKRSYGYRRVRYMGLQGNTTELFFKVYGVQPATCRPAAVYLRRSVSMRDRERYEPRNRGKEGYQRDENRPAG